MKYKTVSLYFLFAAILVLLMDAKCSAQDSFKDSTTTGAEELPEFLNDRGTGMPTSMFGTYIHEGELIVYPFFEYYQSSHYKYNLEEQGYGNNQDFDGNFKAMEGLLFAGYGITDRLSVEIEAAVERATLNKSSDDHSGMPYKLTEQGLSDVETQLRWRWLRETENTPEVFAYWETVFPFQENRVLIGTQEWDINVGAGVIKGFSWGTISARASIALGALDNTEFGEWAVDYLKRISDTWRVYAGMEGSGEDISLIAEVQWHLSPHVFIKANNGFGLTSSAVPWAPEIGVVFSFFPH